jgi:hypothetical protein
MLSASPAGNSINTKPIPHGPVNDAIWRNGKKFSCEYAMHIAEPCAQSKFRRYSKPTHIAGRVNHALHTAPCRISARVRSTPAAKISAAIPKYRNHDIASPKSRK